jgi:NADH-quinone oxidoreductase subunit M
LILLSIASFNVSGLQGAVMQIVNFTVVASSLMLIAGMIQRRLGTSDVQQLGGLAKPMPRLTTMFFLFALSGIGVPLTNGFPAEFMMLLGIAQSFPALALVVVFAAVIGAAYILGFVRQGFFGAVVYPVVARAQDLRARELILLLIPALLVLALGVYPKWLLSVQEASLNTWLHHVFLPKSQLAQTLASALRSNYPPSMQERPM